jgi:hypothetical protein
VSKFKSSGWLLILVLVASGATAWWAVLGTKSTAKAATADTEPTVKGTTVDTKFTAKALLELRLREPHILPRADEKYDPVEFEMYRETQKNLLTSRYVIIAALRDPNLKNRACVQREDEKHNALDWLTGEIHVAFPSKNAGVMQVSATEADKEDAAAIVNAVVNAYMREVVDKDREQRRERYSELQKLSAEKENEFRSKRELLKRELENTGGADEQNMAVRSSLAMTAYSDALREFRTIKSEQRAMLGRIKVAEVVLGDEIPEMEVTVALNTNPTFRDLQSRYIALESKLRNAKTAVNNTEQRPLLAETQAELASAKAQMEQVKHEAANQILNAKRLALGRKLRRLRAQLEFSTEQLRLAEKEVEKKANEAEAVGRISITAQMAKAEVENLERILHNLAEEREHLKIELNAPSRVVVWGDDPTSPASVPEKPD